ncbi:MAG: FAD/NAD(P)-binding protein [Gammaproteobacteria bacterium]
MNANAYLPYEAEIIERRQESPSVFTLRLSFTDPAVHAAYRFAPGQFNMLYLPMVGEVPISIVSDPQDEHMLDHTIRAVGRVTKGLARLQAGDRVGVRGPFGRGWPLAQSEGQNIVLITGGLGCAPSVSVINYVLRRRAQFGRLTIIQGVKHSDDLIWRQSYEQWSQLPDVHVYLAADVAGPGWPWREGRVTSLLDEARIDKFDSVAMLCGPEIMMRLTVEALLERGIPGDDIWLSMERSMQCAVGHCGHCQIGGNFVCRNGPVFPYPEVQPLLGKEGF